MPTYIPCHAAAISSGAGGSQGTEPSMALFANPYKDLQGWKQID